MSATKAKAPTKDEPTTTTPAVAPVSTDTTVPATAKKGRKTKVVAPTMSLISTDEYMGKLQNMRTTLLKPSFLEKLVPPEYQRGIITRQVKRIEEALRNGEFVPDVILSEKADPAGGKPKFVIVDGLQRATAAKNIGFPLRATIIDFGSEVRERQHFVAFQRSCKVNPNIICDVFGDNKANAEIKRISALPDHPFFGKVWFGRGKQPVTALQAVNLTSVVNKKGVAIEELENFTRVIGTLWPVNNQTNPYRSGGFRGMCVFYAATLDTDFDHRNAAHVAHMQKFDWNAAIEVPNEKDPSVKESRSMRDLSRINTKPIGEAIGGALLKHWEGFGK